MSKKHQKKKAACHNIYVIELDNAVLDIKRFRRTNPDYVESMPCVYVGMTGKMPEERFDEHKKGYKACNFVRDFGLHLKPRQYESYNPMTFEEAQEMEKEKARRLRARGWAVWQN